MFELSGVMSGLTKKCNVLRYIFSGCAKQVCKNLIYYVPPAFDRWSINLGTTTIIQKVGVLWKYAPPPAATNPNIHVIS